MANNNNDGVDNNADHSQDSGLDKSFVGKFVSGILNNTPLSKWFGKESSSATKSTIRRRDDDDDDDEDISYTLQPPVKRAKPSDVIHNNYSSAHIFESPVTVHNTSNNINNNVSARVFQNFPEPGPSGIRSRKLLKTYNSMASTNTNSSPFRYDDIVNGDNNDSDSDESTSGFGASSSNIVNDNLQESTPNKTDKTDKISPKGRSLFATSHESSHNRSLFSEKSLSPQTNTSLSSRRPTFNASTFGSPNFIDRTLSAKRIMSSPFYSGNTMYGGASAYVRKLNTSSEDLLNQSLLRTSVQHIKPVNEKAVNENATLSKTARRILSTLEQYSTPISDAKKIPIAPKRQGILSQHIGAHPYINRKKASNKELQVPSIPDLLQMKQRERLQNRTETVRQMATTSKSVLNKEKEYKLPTEEDNNKQKHSNKMKSNLGSVRHKAPVQETATEVNLPKVSLPLTTLPKFDFVILPPPGETKDKEASKPEEKSLPKSALRNRKISEQKNSPNTKFNFSQPLIISKNDKTVSAISDFVFSEPVSKKQCSNGIKIAKLPEKQTLIDFKARNNGENVKSPNHPSQIVSVEKTDTPLASLLKFKTTKATWECPTCLIRNSEEKMKCGACDEPKPSQEEKSVKNTFGDQFKITNDKWECTSCLIRNSNSDKFCVACTTAKPSNKSEVVTSGFDGKFKPSNSTWECTTCLIRNKNELIKCAACETPKSNATPTASFGDKFKPSSDTWECTVCMIRNKNDVDKCAACETSRLGAQSKPTALCTSFSFGDKFKTSTDTWECPACMIRNKNTLLKCAACETAKPGQTVTAPPTTTTAPIFSFGIKQEWECQTCLVKNKNDVKKCIACETVRNEKDVESKKGFGDAFKVQQNEWECKSCMVRNQSTNDTCVCCGTHKATENSSKNSPKKSPFSFSFGINSPTGELYKFGIPPPVNQTTNATTAAVATKENSVVTVAPTISTSAPTFSFGLPPNTSTLTTTSTSSSFTFGIKSQDTVVAAPMPTTTPISQTITSPTVTSSNPLLKPQEKLPEKAQPAATGFKFGINTTLNQTPKTSESIVTSTSNTNSKTEIAAPTAKPMFEFKPAVNGDAKKTNTFMFGTASKPVENTLFAPANKTNEDKLFGVKPPEVTPTTSSATEKSTFGVKLSESSPFANKLPESSPFGSKLGESNLFGSKPAESSPFGSKPAESSPFGSKSTESTSFLGKPRENTLPGIKTPVAESPFRGKVLQNTPFGGGKMPESSPFGAKNPESSLFGNKSTENSPFGSKVTESSPFGVKATQAPPPFGSTSKPLETTPFGSKPAENPLFGSKTPETTSLFGSKPIENNAFGNNKPLANNLFGNKSTETNLFGNKPTDNNALVNMMSTPIPAFKFEPKPPVNPASGTTVNPIFKFGSDSSAPATKKATFGESSENVNGFGGAVAKIPAFGTGTQSFTTETKPYVFGNEAASKSAGFSFGQPEKPVPGPMFSFGNPAPTVTPVVAAPAAAPGFNFSVTSVPNSGFNFGSGAAAAAPKNDSQPFAPQPTNVFGAGGAPGKNGSFNFGTNPNNNNQKAIFSFGASQSNAPPSFAAPSQSGFSFGAPAPAAPAVAPGGFSFTGAPPSFNFTDGNSTMGQPQRKTRRAVRRMQR